MRLRLPIAVKPLFRLTKKTRNAFAGWLKLHDPGRRAFYLQIAKQKGFDNLIAAFLLFRTCEKQNLLTDNIDLRQIKRAKTLVDPDFFEVLREIILFAAEIKKASPDNYDVVAAQCAQKAQTFAQALISLFDRFTHKTQEERQAFLITFESLLAFNFVDLYTYKIEVNVNPAAFPRYDMLASLIVREAELLEAAYAPFRAVAAPVFNMLFRTILTLRKRLV